MGTLSMRPSIRKERLHKNPIVRSIRKVGAEVVYKGRRILAAEHVFIAVFEAY